MIADRITARTQERTHDDRNATGETLAANGSETPQIDAPEGSNGEGKRPDARSAPCPAVYQTAGRHHSPRSAFSGVMGSERTWWPVAWATAEATAASGVLMTISPIDLAPKGPVGS